MALVGCGASESHDTESATSGVVEDGTIWTSASQALTVRMSGGMPSPDGEPLNVAYTAQAATMTQDQLAVAKRLHPVDSEQGLCAEDLPEIVVTVRDGNGKQRSYQSQYNACNTTNSLKLVEHEVLMELVSALGPH